MHASSTEREPPAPKPAVAPDIIGMPNSSKRWFVALAPNQRNAVRQICRMRRADPCAGLIRMKSRIGVVEPVDQLLVTLGDDRAGVDTFCMHANGRRGGCNTPLVVAFEGQRIDFAATPGRFAFTRGQPVASAWPTAATPWIAMDRDGDGAITSGAELFGDSTGNAKNGYEALAALDANHDGTIDRRDPAFSALLLWTDTDGNRRSSPTELRSLSSIVVEIPLAHDMDVRCVRGSCEGERGSVVWRDGNTLRTGAVVDVYLATGRDPHE